MLDSIFTDHMVLQRNKPISIYGIGEEGACVEVTFNLETKKSSVKDGKWKVEFDPLPAGGPYTMIISSGKYTEMIRDILVGDVFLAAGQSNMEFLMKDTKYYETELESKIPDFRYYYVNQVEYEKEGKDYPEFPKRNWEIVNKNNLKNISAVAYYMAKRIQPCINVPIGIVGCHKGGTSASCWIEESQLEKNVNIHKAYVDAYWDDIKNQSEEQEDLARGNYQKCLNDYQKQVKEYQKKYPEHSIGQMKQDIGHTPWPGPKGNKDYGRPSGLYHTMFEKIKDYTYCSVLWYQGEEDSKLPNLYEDLLTILVTSWKKELHDNLLFFIVQLPDYSDDKAADNWALIRKAQENVSKKIDNVEIMCALGCGEQYNIHPSDKSVLGTRLGELVLETYYDYEVSGHSPSVSTVGYSDGRIECRVDYMYDQELINTNREVLEVSYDGKEFEKVDAFVYSNTIYANVIKKPTIVRYAWKNYPDVGFERIDGKPLLPFYKEVTNE